ncbi:hypothetical protein ACPSKX_19340 [Moritella viscosa]
MKNKLYGLINEHPFRVIIMCLIFVVLAAGGAQNLVFKNDYRIYFGEDNPQRTAFESMQKVYSKSDNISFVVVPKGKDVFTRAHLEALTSLTKQSWQIPYSTRVDSITNFQYSYAEEDDLIVTDLVTDPENLSQADLERIEKVALNDPLLVNKIISKAGHVSVVNVTVQLPGIDPILEVPEVAASVRAIRAQFIAKYPDSEVYLSGVVMMNNAFGEAAMNDSALIA